VCPETESGHQLQPNQPKREKMELYEKTAVFVVNCTAFTDVRKCQRLRQATASGTIQGTITDQSQGVVQGAEVIAKNKGTDLTRTISTVGRRLLPHRASSGRRFMPSLSPRPDSLLPPAPSK